MNRRTFLASTCTAVVAGVATRPVAAAVDEIGVYPDDVEIGDERQAIAVAVMGVDADADRLVVAVDAAPLTTAGVGIDDLALDPESSEIHGADVDGWTVEDAVLRIELAVDEEAFRGRLVLTGLDADGAEHAPGLVYEVGVAEGGAEPALDRESDAFDVVDPAEREPTLHVRPSRLELDAAEQSLLVRVREPPVGAETLTVDVNVSELAEAGVELEAPDVSVADAREATVDDSAVLERDGATILRVTLAPEDGANHLEARVSLEGLNTDGAEHGASVAYYAAIAVDGVPEAVPDGDDHDDRVAFDVVDPEEIDDSDPRDEPQPDPRDTPQPESAGGGSGNGNDDAETEADPEPDDQPGFGALAALGGIGAALAARRRAKSGAS